MKAKGNKHERTQEFQVIEGGKRKSTSAKRIGWNAWRTVEGKRNLLLEALVRKANAEGQQLASLAKSLGVTYGYIAQLRNGHRFTEHISDKFARSCARYLCVPAITVKLLAGRVRPEDFVVPAELEAGRIEEGLRRLADDPLLGGFVPATLWDQPDDVKHLVLMLYQEVSGCELFGYARTPEAIEAAIRGASLLARSQLEEDGGPTSGDLAEGTKSR